MLPLKWVNHSGDWGYAIVSVRRGSPHEPRRWIVLVLHSLESLNAVFFSVVIPTYNRKPILEKCLRALEQQTWMAPVEGYEVVVVDDGSTDGTLDWLRSTDAFPHVRLFAQNHRGPSAARNLGVQEAQGDTIIFIDSDLVVTDCFLQSHGD
jgi:GT2 family glycosyltransferase